MKTTKAPAQYTKTYPDNQPPIGVKLMYTSKEVLEVHDILCKPTRWYIATVLVFHKGIPVVITEKDCLHLRPKNEFVFRPFNGENVTQPKTVRIAF